MLLSSRKVRDATSTVYHDQGRCPQWILPLWKNPQCQRWRNRLVTFIIDLTKRWYKQQKKGREGKREGGREGGREDELLGWRYSPWWGRTGIRGHLQWTSESNECWFSVCPSILFSSWYPGYGCHYPHLRGRVFTPQPSLKSPLQTYPQICLLSDSRSCQLDNWYYYLPQWPTCSEGSTGYVQHIALTLVHACSWPHLLQVPCWGCLVFNKELFVGRPCWHSKPWLDAGQLSVFDSMGMYLSMATRQWSW